MRMEHDPRSTGPVIQGFGPAGFRIGDQVHRGVWLTADAVMTWEPPSLDRLDIAALEPILVTSPEFVLLGTGRQLHPVRLLAEQLERRGIGLEIMDSRAAARAWGVIRGEGRRVAAALYPINA